MKREALPVTQTRLMQRSAGWTTPALLRLSTYGVIAAAALLLVAAVAGARSYRKAVDLVGRNAAPAILTADHISAVLTRMKNSAAAEMSSKQIPDGLLLASEKQREDAAEAIARAAGNPTARDEWTSVRALVVGLGAYSSRLQEARVLRKSGDPRYADAYRAAVGVMDRDLLPAASALDLRNRRVLEETLSEQSEAASGFRTFLAFSALVLAGTLLAIQWFLARHMRRVFNPLLVCATLIAIVFPIFAAGVFQDEDQQLRNVKASITVDRLAAPGREQDFARAIDQGFGDLSGFEGMAGLAVVLISGCAFMGLLPRIREYS